ncbi:MAG: cupin domain-containing protein [bacterium]|nr:cupin domain-containing protein [bacterium]
MLIDFTSLTEFTLENMNGGSGQVAAKMIVNSDGKVIVSKIRPKSSIGKHLHRTSNDINFVISGQGLAICGESEETLSPGVCHYCPKGSEHSIVNTGTEDLVLFTVVQELPA